MVESKLEVQLQKLASDLFPRKRLTVKAVFYKSKTLRHTIELKRKTILICVSHLIKDAPEYVLDALGQILFLKLFRYRPDRSLRKIYNNYIEQQIVPNLPATKHRISQYYTPEGTYFNLKEIFQRLNDRYFYNQLQEPRLGWSLKPAYTRLGFYDAARNLLVISRIFDSRKAELAVLEFLMYHEMLHIFFPTQTINGRRRIHSPDFRKKEQEFPGYEQIQKWIRKKRLRL